MGWGGGSRVIGYCDRLGSVVMRLVWGWVMRWVWGWGGDEVGVRVGDEVGVRVGDEVGVGVEVGDEG